MKILHPLSQTLSLDIVLSPIISIYLSKSIYPLLYIILFETHSTTIFSANKVQDLHEEFLLNFRQMSDGLHKVLLGLYALRLTA